MRFEAWSSVIARDFEGRRAMTLLADLDAFLQEHWRCGDLDSAVEGDRVWMACTCGAAINRSADDEWPGGEAGM